jgi:hypothetical protein
VYSVLVRARIDEGAQQIACVVICRLMFEYLEVILELCLKAFLWHTNIYSPATVDLSLLLSCRHLLPNLALLINPGQVRSERLCLCIRVADVFQRLIPCSWRGGTVAIFARDRWSLDGLKYCNLVWENSIASTSLPSQVLLQKHEFPRFGR